MERPQTDTAISMTEVQVTPDDLMVAARRLQLQAQNSVPGQKVFMRFTNGIMLSYDPQITTADMATRVKANLPGTGMSQLIDKQLTSEIVREEAAAAVHLN